MPKRGSSHLRSVPLIAHDPSESNASRLQRLQLGGASSAALLPSAPFQPRSGGQGGGSQTPQPAAAIPNRPDAPVVRNLVRGSVAEAETALRELGADALVTELVQEGFARSGVAPVASLTNTWYYFHHLAYEEVSPSPRCSR